MTARSVIIALKGQIGDFQTKMKQAKASVTDVATKMNSATKEGEALRRSFGTVGDAAGKMGLAAAGALAFVSKSAMDWESAWAGVTKTVDGSTEEMARLEEQLRGLTAVLPATHEEIAGVAEAAGQLGVQRNSIAAFTRTMIDLGETTNLTADEAATAIAQMANVMQTAPEDIDNLGAALVALGNDGASTERDIILMAQRIAGAGAQIGLAESDILAIANAAASMGIEVEAGGTAVSRVFTDMAKAVAQGGDKLDAFASAAGVSAQEFSDAFGEDPAQAFAMFTQGLDAINKSGGDVFSTLEALKLSDVRVQNALLGMAAAGDLLTDSLDLGAQAWDENTALALEAAKRYDTTAAQMSIAWNQIKDAAIDFGEVALPVLANAAESVAGFAQAVGQLPAPVKSAATGLLGLTAIIGGGTWFAAKTVSGIADMRGALSDLGVSAGATSKALKGVGVAAALLGGLTIMDSLQDQNDEVLPGLEALTAQLIELSRAGAAAALSEEFDSLDESITRLTDKNWAQALQDQLYDWGAPGSDSAVDEAKAEIEALDAALANLVATGNADIAAQALEGLGLPADQLDRLTDILPQYEEALLGVENSAALAGDASGDAATGFVGVATAADEAVDPVDRFTEAVEGARAAMEGRQANRAYEQSIDDFADRLKERQELQKELAEAEKDLAGAKGEDERSAAQERVADLKEELADYALTLDEGEQAGRDWNAALEEIADTALTTGETLTGIDQKRFMRKARRDFIDLATQITGSRTEARLLADDLELLSAKDWDINVGLNILRRIEGVGGAAYEKKLRGDEWADGGYTGDGGKYEAAGVVHRGEYVINAEATRRNYALLERINGGYASGGIVATRPAPTAPAMDVAAMAQQFAGMSAPVIGNATIFARDLDDIERQATDMRRQAAVGGTRRRR